MKMNSRKSGFTLIELMVSALVGAVLALTVGSMIVFGYIAWSNNSQAVKIQNDTSLAMTALGRYIRESNINDLLIDGVSFSSDSGALGSRVDFAANSVRPGNAVIAESNGQLILQPEGLVLVDAGSLVDFTAQFNPEGPKVEVRLVVDGARGVADATIRSTFTPRN